MTTRWCRNNDSGRNGTGWDGVQWGTRCLGHRGAASIHIHRGGGVQDALHVHLLLPLLQHPFHLIPILEPSG